MMREPGIYIGLAEEDYFADDGLGSTAQKELALDPVEFQWKRRRKPVDEDTKATIWGHALHARALEGREAFEARFAVAPRKEDFPGVLDTVTDILKHAEKIGFKLPKKGKKDDLIARIRDADIDVPIWSEIEGIFEDDNREKTILTREVNDQIETAAQWMNKDNYLAPFMKDGTFIAGIPEVSIFVEYKGLRLRARIDRLFPHALLDLKSFRPRPNWRSAPEDINRVLGRILGGERYDLQAASYLNIWPLAKKLLDAGKVFGASDADMEILRSAFGREDLKWIWVLVKNTGAPQSFVRWFDLHSSVFKNALDEVLIGLDHCNSYTTVFGADSDWVPQHLADSMGDDEITIF